MTANPSSGKRVLVFGVFDGIHDGHRFLFSEARKHGDQLLVAVAQDAIVHELKGHSPRQPLAERMGALRSEPLIDEVFAGDEQLSSYEIIKKCNPDVIALGYDQQALKEDLEAAQQGGHLMHSFEIIVIGAHHPETLHNAFLQGEKH